MCNNVYTSSSVYAVDSFNLTLYVSGLGRYNVCQLLARPGVCLFTHVAMRKRGCRMGI